MISKLAYFITSFYLNICCGLVFYENATIDESIGKDSGDSLTLLALVNYDGPFGSGAICTKAMELGLDRLVESGKFKSLNLKFEIQNTKCNDARAIRIVAEDLAQNNHSGKNKLPIILLDECPNFGNIESALMMKPSNYIGLTTGLKSTDFDAITKMTTYAMLPEVTLAQRAFMELMLKRKWQRYGVFSEEHPYFNEVESKMFPMFEDNGLELIHISKTNFNNPNPGASVEQAIRQLKAKGAVILFSHTNNPIPFVCWLYRLGMHRNHVLMASAWSMYDPETVNIPTYVSNWCTRDMLKVMLKSYLWFTYGWMADVKGASYQDETDLTKDAFTERMGQKVYEASTKSPYHNWAPPCYDLALFAGTVVEKVENQLNQMNSTLREWTVDGENFQNNGWFIQDMMSKVVFNSVINGQRFFTSVNENTHRNTDGWSPVLFKQVLDDGRGKFTPINVAFFKYSDKSINDKNGGIRWATDDGKPPEDRIRIVEVKLAPTKWQIYAIFTGTLHFSYLRFENVFFPSVLSLILICVCLSSMIEFRFRKSLYRYHHFNYVLLISMIIMQSHTFFIPFLAYQSLDIHCNFTVTLFILGFTFTIMAISMKTIVRTQRKFQLREYLKLTIFPLVISILIIIVLSANSFDIKTEHKYTEISKDGKIEYQHVRDYCEFNGNPISTRSLAVLGCILLIQLLNMVFKAYSTKRAFKKQRASPMNNLAASCCFCQMLIIIAAILIALINHSWEFLTILLPILATILTTMAIGFIEIPRIVKPNDAVVDDQQVSFRMTTKYQSKNDGNRSKRTATTKQKTKWEEVDHSISPATK